MLCREIINGALRKLGKLGSGREARSVDASDALESLRGLYRSLINSGAFGRIEDVVPTATYTAGENQRVFRTSSAVEEIKLPLLVDDIFPPGFLPPYGSRWVSPANNTRAQRPPRDLSVVIISDSESGETQEYIYDGQRNQWVALFSLDLDDEAPLSYRDADGLKAMLALQIADEYGGDVTAATSRLASLFQSNLVSRWSMPRQPLYGSYC